MYNDLKYKRSNFELWADIIDFCTDYGNPDFKGQKLTHVMRTVNCYYKQIDNCIILKLIEINKIDTPDGRTRKLYKSTDRGIKISRVVKNLVDLLNEVEE